MEMYPCELPALVVFTAGSLSLKFYETENVGYFIFALAFLALSYQPVGCYFVSVASRHQCSQNLTNPNPKKTVETPSHILTSN